MEIRKDIPIPLTGYRTKRSKKERKYPIEYMEVGDSIAIPRNGNVYDILTRFKFIGWEFTSRKEEDHHRIWRTK